MKVKFNNQEIDFLKEILVDTAFFALVSRFKANEETDIDDDIVDEIRDLCGGEEAAEVQKAEEIGMIITARGRLAADLVDRLYQ